MKYGFIKVAASSPELKVADCEYNTERIQDMLLRAQGLGAEIVVFPELCITGYTCQDLFQQQLLIDKAYHSLVKLLNFSQNIETIFVVGLPFAHNGILLNCAAVIQKGKLLGLVAKSYLPNYGEFYEKRWFTSGKHIKKEQILFCGQNVTLGTELIFETDYVRFGVEICEDLWSPIPPSNYMTVKGADIILNLSASNEVVGKYSYLKQLIKQQSKTNLCGYLYTSASWGESTQDAVFMGKGLIADRGEILKETGATYTEDFLLITEIDIEAIRLERQKVGTFADTLNTLVEVKEPHIGLNHPLISNENFTLTRDISPCPFLPNNQNEEKSYIEMFFIQALGLAKRLKHLNMDKVVIGVSGGLDSTLALLVCVQAFEQLKLDRKGIVAITLPGFGTSSRTYENAKKLIQSLEVTAREIDITAACRQHFQDINHNENIHDTTFENVQARERTQILMDVANQVGGIVIGTGDLSELALGFATYNGDHMSMYAVNASVPKTLIQKIILWYAQKLGEEEEDVIAHILKDIVDTPISPELLPQKDDATMSQKTEDLIGPYELHDFFLYYVLKQGISPQKIYFLAQKAFKGKYNDVEIKQWITIFFKRFFAQQFKRSCLPDGPKVTECSLNPRGDWRMPSDAVGKLWIEACENL